MRRTLSASLAMGVTGGAALAQDAGAGLNRVVTFGDSLSDNGNLYAVTAGAKPTSPPYNKRFTNGLTFAEYLNGPMAPFGATDSAKNINFAFGGARTDSIAVTLNNQIPGTQDQINAYLGSGGTFGSKTLVTWLAGANNFFNLFDLVKAGSLAPADLPAALTTTVGAASADAAKQFQQLATAGAKTVLVYNLPDLGLSADSRAAGAATAGLASGASNTFNAALAATTKAAASANSGTNFIQIDLVGFLRAVTTNPGAFGMDNVTDKCFSGASVCANPDRYLFWDGVHPTDAAHRQIATYTFMHLYAASLASGVTVMGESGLWARRGLVLDTLDKTRAATTSGDATEFAVTVYGQSDRRDQQVGPAGGIGATAVQATGAHKTDLGGLRLRAQRALDAEWTLAADLSALTGSADAGYVSTNMGGVSADLSARWRRGPLFVTAGAGLGYNMFADYQRRTLFSAITNKADAPGGVTGSLAIETGRDYAVGSVTLTPIVRLAFLSASVGGYTENNLVALSYDRRTLSATTATGELRLRHALSEQTALTGLIGFEGFLSRSGEKIRAQLVGNTAQPFTIDAGRLASPGVQLGLGLENRMGKWTGSAQYRASLGAHSQSHRLSLGLMTSF